jgi:hypothetical protein
MKGSSYCMKKQRVLEKTQKVMDVELMIEKLAYFSIFVQIFFHYINSSFRFQNFFRF